MTLREQEALADSIPSADALIFTPSVLKSGLGFCELPGTLTMDEDLALTGAQSVDASSRSALTELVAAVSAHKAWPIAVPVYRMLTPLGNGIAVGPDHGHLTVTPATYVAKQHASTNESRYASVRLTLNKDYSVNPYAPDGEIGLVLAPDESVVWVRRFLPSQHVDWQTEAAEQAEWKQTRAHWLNLGIHPREEVEYFDRAIAAGNALGRQLQLGLATGTHVLRERHVRRKREKQGSSTSDRLQVDLRQRLMITTFLNGLFQAIMI